MEADFRNTANGAPPAQADRAKMLGSYTAYENAWNVACRDHEGENPYQYLDDGEPLPHEDAPHLRGLDIRSSFRRTPLLVGEGSRSQQYRRDERQLFNEKVYEFITRQTRTSRLQGIDEDMEDGSGEAMTRLGRVEIGGLFALNGDVGVLSVARLHPRQPLARGPGPRALGRILTLP